MSRVTSRVLNAEFDVVTLNSAVKTIFDRIERRDRGWVCTVNVAFMMMMRADAKLQSHVDRAALVLADGQPVVWASRLLGTPLPERVAGIDVLHRLCAEAARNGHGIFLLGATREVIESTAESLRRDHPGLQVAAHDGYFSSDDAPRIADLIAKSGARILLVGMGVPRQEHFIGENWQRLGADIAIGVGGSFDVISGLRRRAPRWMQLSGTEWIYRSLQEPGRLLPRYLSTGFLFACTLAYALILGLIGKRPP